MESSSVLPSLFIGHGSPMNIVADNPFTRAMKQIVTQFQRPQNILVVSAHWVTSGTQILKSKNPKTIHDFGGFPDSLYQIQYPAKGSPELANHLHLVHPQIRTTEEWGLDHGAWSLLVHMFPDASVPVTQLSLNKNLSLKEHFELARDLRKLREQGTLIIASGNIVHNLRQIQWQEDAETPDWAIEFDQLIKQFILQDSPQELWEIFNKNIILSKIAHPSIEHFVPLLYTMGLKLKNETPRFFSEGFQNGSISMRSLIV